MNTLATGSGRRWPPITWVLLGALALRLVHLATSFDSPLFWKGGPDEEFYRAFGRDVAFGRLGLSAEFAFMDPLYGYLLGAVFRLLGDALVPVYLLQIAVDTGTAWMLWRIGLALGRPQVGLVAAALHGLTATALLFSLSLMKATWVAAFMTAWIWLAIRLVDAPTRGKWLGMGALLGLCVALRANLLLLAAASLVLLPALAWWRGRATRTGAALGALLMVLTLAPFLGLLAARNAHVSGAPSITPNNGGVVLHHLYNPENPRAGVGLPAFVGYAHPQEIWRSYKAEAERRTGRELTPSEVNDFWREESVAYIRAHPWRTARNMVRKAGEFIAWPEIPNNRSFEDERAFAPILKLLPAPFGILFALGAPGLLAWWRRDSRALVPLAVLGTGLATVIVFFAEDRFRFNVITPFTLGSAYLLVSFQQARLAGRHRDMLAYAGAVAVCAVLTLQLGRHIPATPMNWERVAWGYVRMGQWSEAARWIAQVAARQPEAAALEEFRGMFAMQRGDYEAAVAHYDLALKRRSRHEVHFNRSLALERLGRHEEALAEAAAALAISEQPDYLLRLAILLKHAGRYEEAGSLFLAIIARAEEDPSFRDQARRARLELTD